MASRHGCRPVAPTCPYGRPPRDDQPTLRDASPGRLSAPDNHLPDLVGYRVLGRYGELGTVVNVELAPETIDGPMLVVRGGISEALVYLVPSRRIVGVSTESCTVATDADVADFVPMLSDEGTVLLRLGVDA